MNEQTKAPAKRGPKADLLKIEGRWEDAVKKTLAKKKPHEGWPKDTRSSEKAGEKKLPPA